MKSHSNRLFLLCLCHIQLFIMEVKLRLLKELMDNKPYHIFPFFYILFERLLRSLQRVTQFLESIENELLLKSKLYWHNIHLLIIQTFLFMDRNVQKAINQLCDSTSEHEHQKITDEGSCLMGRFVFRSYITLEQCMASFSLHTYSNSKNFATFFAKCDDVSYNVSY